MDVGVRRDVWNAFLSLSNLAFAGGGRFAVTTSALRAQEASALQDQAAPETGQEAAAQDAVLDAARDAKLTPWQKYFDEYEDDSELVSVLRRLVALNFPVPTVMGEETDGVMEFVRHDSADAQPGDNSGDYVVVFEDSDFAPKSGTIITLDQVMRPESIDHLIGLPVNQILTELKKD